MASDDSAPAGGAADLLGGAATTAATTTVEAGGGTTATEGKTDAATSTTDAAPDWFSNVSATAPEGDTTSNRDWLAAKGVKDLDGLTKIARDTERALRDGGRVKVPGEGAKPAELAAFRTAIGVPDKVDGYEIKPIANGSFDASKPEGPGNPKTIPLNDALINPLRESALKNGTPKGAFEGLVNDFIHLQLDQSAAEAKAQDDRASAKLKEWGSKTDENVAHVNTAARALQLTPADMNGLRSGLGADRALDLLAKLGSGMAEDKLMNPGGDRRFGVSGAEAQAELDRLKADPEFAKRLMVPGSSEKARWDRLNAASAAAKALAEQ